MTHLNIAPREAITPETLRGLREEVAEVGGLIGLWRDLPARKLALEQRAEYLAYLFDMERLVACGTVTAETDELIRAAVDVIRNWLVVVTG